MALDNTIRIINKYTIGTMSENNGIDLNLPNFHIKQECSAASINIEDVDYEEIIKMETEIVEGPWNDQCMKLLKNENADSNLELKSVAEQLFNKNCGEVCGNCKMEYKDYCMNCGHLIHILDNEMKVGVSLRAMRSIPNNILKIRGSLVEGYRVCALRNIPKGVMFGPYEGLETVKRRNKYLWKIRYAKLIEANGENYCNWMRFINCATTQTEQNLIALQFMGKIYYKTLRLIQNGEELLIYYSSSGYNHLKLSSIQYFQPDIEQINENVFKCPPCCFGFSEEKYLVNHSRVCPYKTKAAIEVNSSTDVKDSEGDTKICGRINNLGLNNQKDKEIGKVDKKAVRRAIRRCDHTLEKHSYAGVGKRNLVYLVEKPYKCSECSYTALQRCNLLNHITSHHTLEKPYKCNECSYATVRKGDLANHIKSWHIIEKSYKCNECSYVTIRNINLVNHIKSCHTMERPYKCTECSYASVRKDTLMDHIKYLHSKEKLYKCNECSHVTPRKTSLRKHIKSCHTMEKSYKCKECSYAAARQDVLLQHVKRHHSTEKPYKCNECPYAAVRKNDLLNHIKFHHTVEKPYECNECSYAAARKSDLVNHIKSCHTKEKPYKCSECSYTALQRSNLLYHITSRHTLEKPYKCNECSYATVLKCNLLSHIKRRHTVK